MKKVTYKGSADVRSVSGEEWDAVSVSSKDVEWNGSGDTQEIANAAADYLLSHNPLEFEVSGESPDPEDVRAAEQEVAAGTGGEAGVRSSLSGPNTAGGPATGTAQATTAGGRTTRGGAGTARA